MNPESMNKLCADTFPGHLGINCTELSDSQVVAELIIKPCHMAPNDFLHAGAVVTLADTCCGCGCMANLPDGATGFTTIELKSNHLSTNRDGKIECVATPVHKGRTTQVWDAVVRDHTSKKNIALFRCTQMILYAAA